MTDLNTLRLVFDESEYSIVALCNTDLDVIFANKALLKAVHRLNDPENINLLQHLHSDGLLKAQISECAGTFRINLKLKPDHRLYKTSFIKHEDHIFFIGELLSMGDQEVLSSMSSLSNETANIERELRRKNRDLELANKKIEELMRTDPLTGLYNRRYLSEFLSQSMNMAIRHSLPLSIIMCDIDDFKKINDSLGHDAGDEVLKSFADIMKSLCRKEDIVVRFGGEEFMIALQNADADQALSAAEKIRAALADSAILKDRVVTASFGISRFIPGDDQDSFIKRADTALYQSKNSGKNRCTVVQG